MVNRIVTAADNGKPLSKIDFNGTQSSGHYTRLAADPQNSAKLIVYDDRAASSQIRQNITTQIENSLNLQPGETYKTSFSNWDHTGTGTPAASSNEGLFGPGVAYDASTVNLGDVVLQIGADADDYDRMVIDLPDMGLKKIGISGLSVLTTDKAQTAISKVKAGIDYVSNERGRMGAYQNRLEHAYNANSNTRENLTAAEAQIRDTDIASEMMAYTKNNILIQSAQSMLAQANQTPQGILQLMQ